MINNHEINQLNHDSFFQKKTPDLPPIFTDKSDENIKTKTSQRITYQAQVEVLRRQLGDLEQIREKLGLSQRRMSQLLMVDPSSWSRWTRKGDEAPPQVWRALQWYLALQDKIPGISNQYFLGENQRVLENKNSEELRALKVSFNEKVSKLEAELKLYRQIGLVGAVFFALAVFALFKII